MRQVRTRPSFSVCTRRDLFENLQVLRHRREGDAERLCQSRNGHGPPVSLSRIARRVGSPSAWNSGRCRWKALSSLVLPRAPLLRQFLREAVKESAPACLDHLGPVRPLNERSLMGEDQSVPSPAGRNSNVASITTMGFPFRDIFEAITMCFSGTMS